MRLAARRRDAGGILSTPGSQVHLIVDAMNVIGARPDGWWRDRAAARRALVGSLSALVDRYDRITVVFDGRASSGEVEEAARARVTAVFAPGGPNAADAAIVDLVATAGETGSGDLVVVTSDAKLAADVRSLGATTMGAGTFRDALSRLESAGPG